ncbi:oligosaccharide flippase family protein [bacterium]|nr:oligosaccharide flippase family protein [bacterium]
MKETTTSKKAGIVLISNIITSSAQALILIVLARLLDRAVLGDVFKLVMIYKTAVILGNLGFSDNPYYFIPKITETARGRFLIQSLKILTLTGFCAGLISGAFFVYFFSDPVIAVVFLITITIELVTSMTPDFLIAVGRVKASSVFNIGMSVLNIGIMIGACYSFEQPIWPLTYSFLAYAVIRLFGSIWLLRRDLANRQTSLPDGLLAEQLQFGIPLGIANLAYRINKQVDNYIVAFLFNSATFAEYTVGSWEIPMVLKIPYSITAVYLTKYTKLFDEGKIKELQTQWLLVGEKVILLLVPIATFFLVFAPEFMHLVFGKQYEQAVTVFQIYTLTLYTRISSYSGLLKAFGESRNVLWRSLNLIGMNIVFNLIFIQFFGLYGAPIGTLTANLIALFLALRKISQVMHVPVSRLLPYSFHFKVTVLSLLLAAGVKYGLRWTGIEEILMVGAGATIYVVVFIVAGSLLGLIRREDRDYFIRFFGFAKTRQDRRIMGDH